MKKRIVLITFLVFWIAFIFYNSIQPGHVSGANSGMIVYYVDKILSIVNIHIDYNTLSLIIRKAAHIFEFAVLSFLFYLVFNNYYLTSRLVLTFTISVAIAIIDETIQVFVEGRYGSIIDVGFDTIGIIFGIGFCHLTLKIIEIMQKKKRP